MGAQAKKKSETVAEVLNRYRAQSASGVLKIATSLGKCTFHLKEGRVTQVQTDEASEHSDADKFFESLCVSTKFEPNAAGQPGKRTLLFTTQKVPTVTAGDVTKPAASEAAPAGAKKAVPPEPRTVRIAPEELANVGARVAAAKQKREGATAEPQPAKVTVAAEPAAAAPAAAALDPTDRKATLGRYEVMSRIATGGLGSVFLCSATGARNFKRLVAVKVLRTDLSHEQRAIEALLHEATLGSRIAHPNLIRAIDFGERDKQPYLVMDYVEGLTLAKMLRRGALPSPVATKILLDVLAGLSAFHKLALEGGEPLRAIHCDISPYNILVGLDGTCRLIDYSSARSTLLKAELQHTEGRAAYIAPERLLGQAFDQRTDLFSLGAVFYEMLTGQKLFQGATHEATLQNVLAKIPTPPSSYGPNCPPSFDGVCLTALARDPGLRFQSSDQMLVTAHHAAVSEGRLASTYDLANFLETNFSVEIALLRARMPVQSLAPTQPAKENRLAASTKLGLHSSIKPAVPAPSLAASLAASSAASSDGPQRPLDGGDQDEGTDRVQRNLHLNSKQRAVVLTGAAFVMLVLLLALIKPTALSFLFHFDSLDGGGAEETATEEGKADVQVRPLPQAAATATKEKP